MQAMQTEEEQRLGKELDAVLGEEKFKAIGEQIAFVFAKYGLTQQPEISEKILDYMVLVIRGWNSV